MPRVGLYGSLNKDPTGPSQVTAGVAYGVAATGAEVEIVTNGDRTEHPHERVTVKNIPAKPNSVPGFVRAKSRAAKYVQGQEFDVFHSLAGTMSNADILTCQGIFSDLDFLRWCPSVIESPRTFAGANVYSVLKTIGILRSSTLVATSPLVVRQLQSYLRTSPDEVVPLGIYEGDRELESKVSDPTQVLVPGRVEPRKGQDRILRHLSPDADTYDVDVVGGIGDETYLESIGQEWEDRIHGFVSRERLDRFYRDADIVVIPSRHETFGITAVEAIAKGCTLVITDRCGFATFDEANEANGVYVVADGEKAGQTVKKLATSDNLAENCRAAYECSEKFTWERIGDQYRCLYASV